MKKYFVIRNGHVVHRLGYENDVDARIMARRISGYHPRALVLIVEVIDTYKDSKQQSRLDQL